MEVIFLKIPGGHQWVRIDAVMILYSAVVDLQYCEFNYLDCKGQPLLLTGPFTFFDFKVLPHPLTPHVLQKSLLCIH